MYSPFRLLVILIVAVFVAELSIMMMFSLLPPIPLWVENALDAFLLAVVLFPILYLLLFRPLRLLLAQQMHMRAELEAANKRLQQDIRERQKVEDALRESKNEFQVLFESASDCILILDQAGRITDINHTGYERLGYSKEEMLGKRISEFDPPEFAAHVPARIAMIQSQGYAVFESAHVRKDGSVMPVEINTRAIEINGQQRFLSVIRDITERKQADAALLKSKANLRAMLDNLPFLTWLKDAEGRFISINKVFADYLRLDDPHEVEGKTDLDLQPKELAEKYRADDAEVMATRKQKHVQELVFDGDRVHWAETFKTPIIDEHGNVLGTAGFARDITERQLMEQQLGDSLLFNQTILNKSPYGIAVYSADGPCIMANEAYARNVGGTIEQVLQQDFRTIASWQRTGILDVALKALETGQDNKGDFEGKTTFGKEVFFEFTFSPIAIQGKPHLVLMMNDIMERVFLQRSLVSSMRQIEEKELAKTRFLAAAGHDLRQPLAAANLFIDALKLTAANAQQERLIQRLDQSIVTFKDMLDALLNVSKLEAGVIKPEYISIDVAELFGWLDQNFGPLAYEKRLGFRLHFPLSEKLFVRSDIGLLQSVLMNLVSNAIKFTAKGALLICARRRGKEVLFQIWDTGMGIQQEYLTKIFDEFYQVNNPQRDRTQGLGLGLPIAKRALSLLGGEITCRSQSGRGTVFEFCLPLSDTQNLTLQAAPAGAQEDKAGNDSLMRGKRFVVVEDDELVAHAMISFLELKGAGVKRFNNAEEALIHDAIEHADYFVVDYMLGGTLSGIQFLNQLRQKLGRPIRAVLVTGDTSSAFIREAADCSWTVLHKPINISRLLSSLELPTV